MYSAQVIKVMIACPSDCEPAKNVIRHQITDWNAAHSEPSRLILAPIAWDTHASPTIGERPQEVINKQVLRGCDLLVAVFWTRLGSPTGKAASGTVEEIHEHVLSGKPAMLYFSKQPVALESVDESQLMALRAFENEMRAKGIVEAFEDNSSLSAKFSRQLATLINQRYSEFPLSSATHFNASDSWDLRDSRRSLSAEAQELLKAAILDKGGDIMNLRAIGGRILQTNGQNFVEQGNPRSAALWDAALRELEEEGLVEAQGYKREVFRVTHLGYQQGEFPST